MKEKQREFGRDLFGFRNDIDRLANGLFSKVGGLRTTTTPGKVPNYLVKISG